MNSIKRNIKYIVVHCTGTQPTMTIEAIKNFWKEERKWGDTPGYHYIILRDGETQQLLEEEKISYGAYGHNHECIHIAYVGGIDKEGKPIDNRTASQKHSLFDKLIELTERHPEAQILGHRDFAGVHKACPCFDVKTWLKDYTPDIDLAA